MIMTKLEHSVDDLIKKFNEYRSYKSSVLGEWRLVRSLYKGQFWQVFKEHLEEYSLTPDWNYFEYAVQAYLNSIYSGAFVGTLTPKKETDDVAVRNLNAFIAYNWNKWGMKNKFLHVGENGELYNLGAVRIEWDHKTETVKLDAVAPHEIYFDPSVDNYKNGQAIFLERAINIDTLAEHPDYGDAVKKYMKNVKSFTDKTAVNRIAGYENIAGTENKMVSFIECFIKNDVGTIDQIFILDEKEIIFENNDMPIDFFPIVCYSPQRPDGNPYGSSKLNKILNTVVVLNLIDSMEATQPYRLLNRVRFVDVSGRINMRAFADYGNTPGASFEVKGNPDNLVKFVEVPVIPDMTNLKHRLENSIFQITGVDPQYKGRMTNSLQTTGATQAFQARVTMLTDNARITLLEEFCEDLTKSVLAYYFHFGGDKQYQVPVHSTKGTNRVVDELKLNFSEMKDEGVEYDYTITASTLLPMNQANLFESAKALYEMQGQYQFKKQLVTEQDLLRFSDFPQKDLWLQRLEMEEQSSTAENLVSDLTNFASIFSKLLSQGLSEEQAAQQAITILIEEKNAINNNPNIGQGFI